MDSQNQKEWEELYKHFQEVIDLIYDNKGVIQSLERQKQESSSEEASSTLDEQIEEIHLLLQNHQEDLLETLEKGKLKFPEKLGPSYEKIERAIQKLDIKTLSQELSKMK